jgi:hypothetical protein
VGDFRGKVQGSSDYIRHLTLLLSDSLPKVSGVDCVELQLSRGVMANAAMCASFALNTGEHTRAVHSRLEEMSESGSLGTPSDEAALAFRAAWRLAIALGGTPSLKTEGESVKLEVSLPLTRGACVSQP